MQVEVGMAKIGDVGIDEDLLDLREGRILGLRATQSNIVDLRP